MMKFHYKELDKREHPLRVFYPLWHVIVAKLSLYPYLEGITRVKDELRVLELSKDKQTVILTFWYKKISYMAVVIIVTVLFYVLSLSSQNKSILHENKIHRESNYIGSEISVNARLSGEEEYEYSDIPIQIEKEQYTEEEFYQKINELEENLLEEIRQGNESIENVQSSLELPDELFTSGILIEWRTEDDYIRTNGEVLNEDLTGPVESVLRAIYTYQAFEQSREYRIRILPKSYTKEEALYREYTKKLNESVEQSKTEETITLPDRIADFMITYEMNSESLMGRAFILGLLVAIIIWFGLDRDVMDQNRKRKDQLLYDYPEMIQKLTLLISAGMTVRAALLKIATQKEVGRSQRRYLQEEIKFTLNEIMTGVSEVVAYEHMGRRIGLIPYLRLGTYLSQNVRKGSRGLVEQLLREAVDAFEGRKDVAKQLGEKAGTKLLMPMIIMLGIVLIITMYPAFSSMGG